MESDNDFFGFMSMAQGLVTSNRPLRLRLELAGGPNEDMLLPQRVFGSEVVCGGIEYRVLCVSSSVRLPLKQMIAVPATLEFVTDRGDLRSVCGIVTEASSGDSDGGLASYQLVLRDALAILEKRTNTRVFRNMNEVEIVQRILNEWRQKSAVLGSCFNHEVDEIFSQRIYPQREFTMQHNESDAAFIRRLLKRRGIAWYIRADGAGHTLVLFNSADSLRQNAAGTIRYHRDSATEERDTITSWSAVRRLQPGVVTQHSWDYLNPQGRDFMMTEASSGVNQGGSGNELAASLVDYQVLPPHAGDDNEDLCRLGQLRMNRHDYESKCFHGEGSVRDLCAGEYFTLAEHPEIDLHALEDRDFVVTSLQVTAQNNLPQALASRVEQLFDRNRWMQGAPDLQALCGTNHKAATGPMRMHIQFTAVRRSVTIVPAYNPQTDVPQAQMQSAIVVGPEGEEVHCDQLGRVKIRFPSTRPTDHEEAAGAGASDTDADSAWVRVASNWAGNGPGAFQQCGMIGLPRVGTEVLISFIGADPDKPVIVGQLYNQEAQPASLSGERGLPDDRCLSGFKSREIQGDRNNQLRFDDTNGQINAQLASAHGRSELNLGFLTALKANGQVGARGQGVEIVTDEAIAIRSAKGLLLSAWARINKTGRQLARDEFLSMVDQSTELARSLGKYAEDHQAFSTNLAELRAFSDVVNRWDADDSPDGPMHKDAAIAITAPKGISFATPKANIMYAGTNLELLAHQHMQMCAAQKVVINAGSGVSLFAQNNGLSAIAHRGQLLLQSQHGNALINASKNITFTASEGKLIGFAKEIVLVSEDGSFIKIGDGVNIGTTGEIIHHGASFNFSEGQTMRTAFPEFSASVSEIKRELQIELIDADGQSPKDELISILFHTGESQHHARVTKGICLLKDLPQGGFTIFQSSRRS